MPADQPTDADPGRFYVTTPIYYVNDAPHIGHAYTTVIADALARWHRLLGDDVFFLTGTDEHGLKVQRAAEAARRHAAGVGRPRPRSGSARRGSCSTSPTTTSSAPPSPATTRRCRAAPAGLRRRRHRARTRYEGLYCVSLRGVLHRGRAGRRQLCPIHGGRSSTSRRRTTSSELSAFAAAAARLVRRAPRRRAARGQAQRGARASSAQGLRDFSISRTSITWGVPLPWDAEHVAYVWFDALINYFTAVGYGADAERFDAWWPRATTSSARTSSASTASTGRRCCWRPGIEPPAVRRRARLPARRRREDEQDGAATRSHPPTSSPTSASTASATTSCADTPFGPDGDFCYEAMVARYNADLANNLGNLLSPGGHRGRQEVRRRRPGAARRQPARARWPPRSYAATAAAWDGVAAVDRASTRTWRLIRETNAYLEANEPWKAEPGPDGRRGAGRRARGAAHRRHPGLARRCPRRRAGDLGAHRPRRRGRRPAPARRRPRGAATRAASPVEKGDPLFPRIKSDRARRMSRRRRPRGTAAAGPWIDTHCHLPSTTTGRRRPPVAASAAAQCAPASTRHGHASARDADARRTAGDRRRARPHDDVWATVGLHPHDAKHGVDGRSTALLDDAGGRGRRRVRARLPLRPLAARRRSARRSPRRSRLAHAARPGRW